MTESATGPLKHLGTIVPPEHLHNIAWVNAEGRTLRMSREDRAVSGPTEHSGHQTVKNLHP